jgi:hypothetical protein
MTISRVTSKTWWEGVRLLVCLLSCLPLENVTLSVAQTFLTFVPVDSVISHPSTKYVYVSGEARICRELNTVRGVILYDLITALSNGSVTCFSKTLPVACRDGKVVVLSGVAFSKISVPLSKCEFRMLSVPFILTRASVEF